MKIAKKIFSEKMVGDGNKNNKLFPVNEISGEDVDKVLKYIGKGPISISKLASYLGTHYMRAQDLVDALEATGKVKKVGGNLVTLLRSNRYEYVVKRELNISNPDGTYTKRMCEVRISEGDSGSEVVSVFDTKTFKSVLESAFIPPDLLKKK